MSVPLDPESDALDQFRAWFDDALEAGIELPEAVCLATATNDGAPSARMVLYKGLDAGRFCFFTNYSSVKACELAANPHAAMVFYWHALHRQVRVEGQVERLADDASDRYFLSRPRGSRISAWASRQSRPIDSRESLVSRVGELESRFVDQEVTRPSFWGGFALTPQAIEFWTGFRNRLHDRVRYERQSGGWSWVRLQP